MHYLYLHSTTIKSFILAPDLLVPLDFESKAPIEVILIINPLLELVVSPPTKSTPYFLHAALIPKYNSSKDSKENLFETAMFTVI